MESKIYLRVPYSIERKNPKTKNFVQESTYTDAKTYKCANNVCVKKILSWVKSLQNVTFFVEKVSNVAILRFLVAFLSTF